MTISATSKRGWPRETGDGVTAFFAAWDWPAFPTCNFMRRCVNPNSEIRKKAEIRRPIRSLPAGRKQCSGADGGNGSFRASGFGWLSELGFRTSDFRVNGLARAGIFLALAIAAAAQPVVINEIMYHPLQPAFGAEPVDEEYIELVNRSATNVNLAGWRFTKGVTFTFPSVTLLPGRYLVVVGNAMTFDTKFPTVEPVVGNWAGTLGNNGETIQLVNAAGDVVDEVRYASEGDWAQRQRGPNDLSRRGWVWYSPADGLGRSMERRSANMLVDSGQNWAPSPVNGTPGAANSVVTNNLAPLILELSHSPVVPKSTESIAVSARIRDESASGLTVVLFYRTDLNPQTNQFAVTNMLDDGTHGDGGIGDGIYGALLPPQPNSTVIEFYAQATDLGGRTRTWPGPAIAAGDGTGPTGQVANALLQVDDPVLNAFGGVSAYHPVYKMIMTENERVELAGIPCSGSQNSDAEMNGTWISLDGAGTELRYNCGFRNRGHGSRCASPPNYRVNIPTDRPWKSRRALNLNTVNTPAQILGATIAKKAGVPGADSRSAQVRVNNANLAGSGSGMLGAYAVNEELNSDWVDEHFPFEGGGNIYRAIRDIFPPDFVWRGTNVNAYVNTYFKTDNTSENDWSDLIQLHRIVGTNDQFTTASVRAVVNVEEWCAYYAVMSLFGNNETSPNGGYNDDYFMYRGGTDQRFHLMYYDNDTILGFGSMSASTGIFTAEAPNGMGAMTTRFLEWPDFKPVYYATLQRLLDTTFSQSQFNALVDEVLSTYPPTTTLTNVANTAKNYMSTRRATVQSLINGFVPPNTNNPLATVVGEPRSPTPFNNATLTVGGNDITHYRFKLNNGAFGAETPVGTPIALTGLPNGSTNTVSVIGRNSAGIYQSQANPTMSKTWVVNTAWPTVRLNEVLARNSAAVNHNGNFPDAIELFNDGAGAVDLSGMRLTDDPANTNKFTFPPATLLAAGDYLVVFPNEGAPGFTLDGDGAGVYLFNKTNSGGALLDSVVFGPQLVDKSIGRFANGNWALCQPSFGGTNVAQALGNAAGLKLNEWLPASGVTPYLNDFIEIFNPDALPVALGGMYLTDEPIGAPVLHRLVDLSFIAGLGHLEFVADGDVAAGGNHLNFQLDSDHGEIGLLAASRTLVDCVSYPASRIGVAQGRCPDGSASIVFLAGPTPGGVNACPSPPPPAGPPAVLTNLLPVDATWRYLQSSLQSNNLDGVNWQAPDYDDSSWPSGPGPLGVGGAVPEPVRTPLTTSSANITYYFRSSFVVPAGFTATSLQFSNEIDDGAVFYLNGREVARYNMPAGPLGNQTPPAQGLSGPPSWTGPISISITNIMAGSNRIAIEVHNNSPFGDVFMGTRLDGVIVSNAPPAPVSGSVVINEILANNATVQFPDGTTPDYVEFYNPSTSAVNLAFSSLSDSPSNPQRWSFPEPTILQPGGYLVITFDSGQPASPINTGFGLKTTGDKLYLFGTNGTPLDSVVFGLQTPDFAIGRAPSGTTNWTLVLPSAGAANTPVTLGNAGTLKVNEWMAAPASGDDWFEIYNPDPQPVALGGLWLSDKLGPAVNDRIQSQIQALSFIGVASNAFQRFWADNPNTDKGADHVNFKLNGDNGEAVGISAVNGTLINGYAFGPQALGVSEGRLPDGGTSIVRFPGTDSPGESNYLPLTNVVINELLSHTDPPLEDAVELKNTTGTTVDISGWYLSDSKNNFRKFIIPAGTVLAPHGFKVFYEYQFNDPSMPTTAFAFSSAKGDQIYLSAANTNTAQLTGYRASVKFGAAANGVSFGRYVNSQTNVDFVATSQRTFGADAPVTVEVFRTGTGRTNAYPLVGPIVVSEIMYHPPDMIVGVVTNDNTVDEFIELKNITVNCVSLFDASHPTNGWRLRDAVDFDFDTNHVLPPGGSLLVVSFDPATNGAALAQFQTRYGTNSLLVGPWSGKLDNSNERIELYKPDPPQLAGADAGFVPYVLVEKVEYADRGAWPTNADGHGATLQCVNPLLYGNEPLNWMAAAPAPAPRPAACAEDPDRDHDGMPNDWETAHGFNPDSDADAGLDADNDALTNVEEYLAGTDPRDAMSYLKVDSITNTGGLKVIFTAIAGKTYTVQFCQALPPSSWTNLVNVPPQPVTQPVMVLDPDAGGPTRRYYRLVTPAQ